MKNLYCSVILIFCAVQLSAQIGISTTTPHSALSVTGSLATTYRNGADSYTILTTDYAVINTVTTATWITGALTFSQIIKTDASTRSVTLPATAGCNLYNIVFNGTAIERIN